MCVKSWSVMSLFIQQWHKTNQTQWWLKSLCLTWSPNIAVTSTCVVSRLSWFYCFISGLTLYLDVWWKAAFKASSRVILDSWAESEESECLFPSDEADSHVTDGIYLGKTHLIITELNKYVSDHDLKHHQCFLAHLSTFIVSAHSFECLFTPLENTKMHFKGSFSN